VKTYYQKVIEPLAPGYDPRHIEAYMRVQHSTLGSLTPQEFAAEVNLCKACVDEAGVNAAEACALSFGL
jgi:hypothetical protein